VPIDFAQDDASLVRALRRPLDQAQRDARDFVVSRPAAAVWLDVGGGKTRVVLEALEILRPPGHTLVIAPVEIARTAWPAQISDWGFAARVRSLTDAPEPGKRTGQPRRLAPKERRALYEELRDPATPPAIWVSAVSLLEDLVAAMGFDRPCGPDDYRDPSPRAHWPFPTVVIDEAQEFKNPRSKVFLSLFQTRCRIQRIVELTGTPANQSHMDLWSQMALLDGGASLGTSFYEFRGRYFFPNKVLRDGTRADWQPKPGAEQEIRRRVAHLVISKENRSSLRPPDPVVGTYHVRLAPDVQRRYRAFLRDRVMELAPDLLTGEAPTVVADTAAHLRAVLLQFASGTVYTGPNHRRDFEVVHDAKVEALLDVLRGTPTPVMVAYRFQADETRLLELLPAAGFPTEKFDGSPAMVRRWNAREIPAMLLQPASSGRGLNLQGGGRTIVWYTLPDSLEHWTQTNGRLVRIGQPDVVDIVRIITDGTVDVLQVPRLERKHRSQQDLRDFVDYVRSQLLP